VAVAVVVGHEHEHEQVNEHAYDYDHDYIDDRRASSGPGEHFQRPPALPRGRRWMATVSPGVRGEGAGRPGQRDLGGPRKQTQRSEVPFPGGYQSERQRERSRRPGCPAPSLTITPRNHAANAIPPTPW